MSTLFTPTFTSLRVTGQLRWRVSLRTTLSTRTDSTTGSRWKFNACLSFALKSGGRELIFQQCKTEMILLSKGVFLRSRFESLSRHIQSSEPSCHQLQWTIPKTASCILNLFVHSIAGVVQGQRGWDSLLLGGGLEGNGNRHCCCLQGDPP